MNSSTLLCVKTNKTSTVSFKPSMRALAIRVKSEKINVVTAHSPKNQNGNLSCPNCTYESKRSHNINRHHADKHQNIRPHVCPFDASHKFKEKHHLEAHINTHTNNHVSTCSPCNRSFGDKSNFLRHNKSLKHLHKLAENKDASMEQEPSIPAARVNSPALEQLVEMAITQAQASPQ